MTHPGERPLRAPFPWFGGKSRVAPEVWARFGDVANYVEPFAGSLAVLLARPHTPRTETVNDRDAYLANFWRAIKAEPDSVAFHAERPVNETDLHARHEWLVTTGAQRIARLEHDPNYYDAQVAGWWVWGVCAWIASGWCAAGPTPGRRLPHLSSSGMGVHRIGPDDSAEPVDASREADHAPCERETSMSGEKVDPVRLPQSLPHLGGSRGVHRRHIVTVETFHALSHRLRHVRVTCGDWARIMGPSVTFGHGITGVFLDPPYGHAERSIVHAIDDPACLPVPRTQADLFCPDPACGEASSRLLHLTPRRGSGAS